MHPRTQFFLAAALFVIGIAKAAIHMTAATSLSITTCLGHELVLPIQASFWERAHCWGCYAAVAAAVWMAALSLNALATRHALIRPS